MGTEYGQEINTAKPILARTESEDSILRNYYSKTYAQDKKVGLLVFRIGDGVFAIASLKTQEIIRSVDITRVPHLEKYILGITNLRGKILPICDLRHFFGLKNTIFDRDTRVIIAKFNQGSIGFVVDEVVDTIHVAVSSLEKNNSTVSSLQFDGFISGICNHQDGIIFLLNILKVAGIESALGESDPLDDFLNMLGDDKKGGKGLKRSGITDASTTDASTTDASTSTGITDASTSTGADDASATDADEMGIDEMIAMELALREKAMAERYHGTDASTGTGATDASTGTGATDASATDASATDASATDASTTDASADDASTSTGADDASTTDASATDASTTDASATDASTTDASTGAGATDASTTDASTDDANAGSDAMTSGEALSKLFSTLNNEYATYLGKSRGADSSTGVAEPRVNFKELVAVFGMLGSGDMVVDEYPQKFYGVNNIPQDMGALIQMETRSRSR